MNGYLCNAAVLLMGFMSMAVMPLAGQGESEYQVQPIFTRYAETVRKVTFNANARVFNDVELQEADEFDGWTVDADLTFPIPYTKHFQVRLS